PQFDARVAVMGNGVFESVESIDPHSEAEVPGGLVALRSHRVCFLACDGGGKLQLSRARARRLELASRDHFPGQRLPDGVASRCGCFFGLRRSAAILQRSEFGRDGPKLILATPNQRLQLRQTAGPSRLPSRGANVLGCRL